MKPWKRIQPTREVTSKYRSIIVKTFRLPNDTVQTFDTYDQEGLQHAGVIALTTDNKILVARQFRAGPEIIMDEIPGGTVEAGEDPQAAAIRELQEETGYKPAEVEYLGKAYKDAYMNATWHFYLATGCAPNGKGQQLEESEDAELRLISVDTLIENAKNGKMTDVPAVLMAYEKLKKMRK